MVAARRLDNLKNYLFLASKFRNSYELIRAFRSGPPCDTAVMWNGNRVFHPKDRAGFVGTILELWKDHCYTREDFYHPQAGDQVVDAGAHVGLFSLSMAFENPECRVLALEPFEENYECLVENLHQAGVTNVIALRCALGGSQEQAFMQSVGTRSIDHLLQDEPTEDGQAVPVISLGGILAKLGVERVAMLKMDVEGAEFDAFSEAKDEELVCFERIAMEYHDNLRPGTLELIQDRLAKTHDIVIEPTFDRGYGILLAKLKTL